MIYSVTQDVYIHTLHNKTDFSQEFQTNLSHMMHKKWAYISYTFLGVKA